MIIFGLAAIGNTEVLSSYMKTAFYLLKHGYYDGLIEAIQCCFARTDAFAILDSPSGSGKTLAGVALWLLDSTRCPDFKIAGTPITVFQFVWPTAVGSQQIYRDIVASSKSLSTLFFESVKQFNFDQFRGLPFPSGYIWENLIGCLFPGVDTAEYRTGARSLMIIIDEIPDDPEEVALVGRLREALKAVDNLCLLMVGTNSKMATMVDISKASSGLDFEETVLWGMIVTRLPRFVPDALDDHGKMMMQSLMDSTTDGCSSVRGLISLSISNRGNPRLILFAIKTACEELVIASPEPFFYRWQRRMSERVMQNKFNYLSYTKSNKGLIGQLNLLMEASSTSELSDVLLSYHFAYRSIPDFALSPSSDAGVRFNGCGGCLYISTPSHRALGSSLVFAPGPPKRSFEGLYSWQRTCFPPPHIDILLYLASCRPGGFFTTMVGRLSFRAHQLIPKLWNGNIAGSINCQNPKAVINTGSLLEVLVAAAVPNAAARASERRIYPEFCSAADFLVELTAELGLTDSRLQVNQDFLRDRFLSSLRIPKFIFPGNSDLLFQGKYRECFEGNVGILERQQYADRSDLVIKTSSGILLQLELKDRDKFTTKEILEASEKLYLREAMVGVLVVRGCPRYWGKGTSKEKNRQILIEGLKLISRTKLCAAYLVSSSGAVQYLQIRKRTQNMKRLILIQVPAFALQ
jgi:hypothetical protein